jgi:3-oxoacyl-[acyl-carrier-protein] synthase-3
MKISGIHIAGIGTAKTGYVTTEEAVRRGWWNADERDRSGLISVSIAGDTPAPDLAVDAARQALEESGHGGPEVGALFHTNVHPQGPDGWSAQHYINRNTINQPVTSIEVHNGCAGFFSSLHLAACFLEAGSDRPAVLLTAADNFGTPAVDRWHVSGEYVLADGGGAVVLSRRSGFARLLAIGAVSDPESEIKHRAGERMFPPSLTEGKPLNFRGRMEYFQQQAARGEAPPLEDFGYILAEAVEMILKDADVTLDEVTKVIHDGFSRDSLHDMFLDPLGIEDDRAIWEFTRRVGHAGPLDMIRGLEYVWKNRLARAGDKVLLLGCAPGMEAACAVLEIVESR